jgi:site-specific recombinase XerD
MRGTTKGVPIVPMDTCPEVDEFLAFLVAEKGFSPLTVRAYASDLSQFATFASAQGTPEFKAVSTRLVRAWIVSLNQRGLASSSIARHICALRSFWRFLLDSDVVQHDPLRSISAPKRQQPLPMCLTADELQLLIEAAGSHRDPVVAARDHAIITVLGFTGMRRGEVLGLRLHDVAPVSRSIHVRQGKGRKDRMIPATGEVLAAVDDWLRVRPRAGHDYLFTTVCGNRIYPSRLQLIWECVKGQSGVSRDGVTLHTLRHTFATLLLRNGADLVTIQRLLGHTRLDTTAIYLHADAGDLRRGVERHPLACPATTHGVSVAGPVVRPQSEQAGWRLR